MVLVKGNLEMARYPAMGYKLPQCTGGQSKQKSGVRLDLNATRLAPVVIEPLVPVERNVEGKSVYFGHWLRSSGPDRH